MEEMILPVCADLIRLEYFLRRVIRIVWSRVTTSWIADFFAGFSLFGRAIGKVVKLISVIPLGGVVTAIQPQVVRVGLSLITSKLAKKKEAQQ